MLEQENIANKDKMWEQKIKSANINFFLKKIADSSFLRTETVFDKKWKLNKLINAVYNPTFKKQWDDKLQESNISLIREDNNNFGLVYQRNKKQMTFQSRDFYEKFFEVFHNGIYYRLSSSAEGLDYPLPEETVRA